MFVSAGRVGIHNRIWYDFAPGPGAAPVAQYVPLRAAWAAVMTGGYSQAFQRDEKIPCPRLSKARPVGCVCHKGRTGQSLVYTSCTLAPYPCDPDGWPHKLVQNIRVLGHACTLSHQHETCLLADRGKNGPSCRY